MFKHLIGKLKPGKKKRSAGPRLSVIVVCYQMEEQMGNTVRSLLPPYQRKLKTSEYEILLIDNGSAKPLPEATWKQAGNVHCHYIPPGEASPNPGVAVNRAVKKARGEAICVILDGARMMTPRVLSWGLRLLKLDARSMVEVRAWHLGPKPQQESVLEGYDHAAETRLLEESRWWENGYRLFEISAPTSQTRNGFGTRAVEATCFFMTKALFQEIGGFNEAYKAPGGGWVSLDFYARAVEAAEQVFTVLGEGTFHQVHGGASTGLSVPQLNEALTRWGEESRELRGELRAVDGKKFILAGHLPRECERWLVQPRD